MNVAYIALIAVAVVIVVAAMIVVALRRPLGSAAAELAERLRAQEVDLRALREAKAESDRRLAVADEKASHIPGLEASLGEARALAERLRGEASAAERAHGATKEALAAKSEAASRGEALFSDLSRDLAAAEKALGDLRADKGRVDEELAARSEAVERLEVAARELRDGIAASKADHVALAARYDALNKEAGELRTQAAEAAARLVEKSDVLEGLRKELGETHDALTAARDQLEGVRTELATSKETLAQERKQADEKLKLLNDAQARLAEQFKVLAEEVMGRHGETFKKQNKDQIDGLLTPLREQLTAFQQGLQTAHIESGKDRVQLAEQIRSLATTGATMTNETRALARALKSETHTQGAWGEMILSTILQRSGLREGEEYITQESLSTEEGRRLRPDVIVRLPEDNRVVIDSKVSLTAFTDYVNEHEPGQEAGHLARHVTSLRDHIKGLSGKEYQRVAGPGLDFVLMFVPVEAALAAAVEDDPGLTTFALERSVAIVTPTTLMLALRMIANLWHVERRNKNAEEIAGRAGLLYDKFAGFVTDMEALGVQLRRVESTYNGALGKLSTGTGNLVCQAAKLKALGANAAKALPQQLVDASDEAVPVPTQIVAFAAAAHAESDASDGPESDRGADEQRTEVPTLAASPAG